MINKSSALQKRPWLFNIPLFIIFPFFSFILSLRNLKYKTNALIFITFCVLYGFAFSFQYTVADSYRVAMIFDSFKFEKLTDIYQLYLLGDSPDLYKFFSYVLIKKISSNPKVLFAFYGLIFGVLWYAAIRLFLNENANTKSKFIYILFFIFLISNSIVNINGARFNTAIWMFFIATMHILMYNNKRYYILLFATPLVHFSFFFPLFLLVCFMLIKKFLITETKISPLLYYGFIISFLLSWILESNIINAEALGKFIPSDSITRKVELYSSDQTASSIVEKTSGSLFLQASTFFNKVLKVFYFLFVVMMWRKLKKVENVDKELLKLFAFLLFFLSLGFIASAFPSGIRFLMIGFLFCIIYILKYYRTFQNSFIKKTIYFLLPVYSFKFVSLLYFNLKLLSATIWYGNCFWIIYEGIGFTFVYI